MDCIKYMKLKEQFQILKDRYDMLDSIIIASLGVSYYEIKNGILADKGKHLQELIDKYKTDIKNMEALIKRINQ